MIALGLCTAAWVDGDAAEIEGKTYQDLQTAVNEADGKGQFGVGGHPGGTATINDLCYCILTLRKTIYGGKGT